MSRLWSRLTPLLVIVWALALPLAHYVVQFPLTPARLAGIAALPWSIDPPSAALLLKAFSGNLLNLAAVVSMLVLGGALGRWLIEPVTSGLSAAERVSLQALLGLGLISFPVLVVGLLGWLPPIWLAWLLTFAGAGLLRVYALAWARELGAVLRLALAPEPSAWSRWLRRAVIALLALAMLLALAPPAKWDALTYHLAGPRQYLEAGRIFSFQENHFLNFPQVVSMLYLWLMRLAGPEAAALLHWGFGGLLILAMWGFALRIGHAAAGWLAALIMLSADSLWMEFYWPYNDLALMAFLFAAIVLIQEWSTSDYTHRWRPLLAAGAFVGLAMGTKYTAAAGAVGVAALIAWSARRVGWRFALISVAVVALTTAVVFAPWLVKNAVLDGNPIAPFGAGTTAFDELDQWYYTRPGTGLNWAQLIFVPLQAAIFSQEGASFQAASGVLPVALLSIVPFAWRKRDPAIRGLLLALIVFIMPPYAMWVYGASVSWFLLQARLLYPIYPALALLLALSLATATSPRDSLDPAPLIYLVVAVVAAFSFLNSLLLFVEADAMRVAVGLQDDDDYLLYTLGPHYAAMQAVNDLPPDSVILFLWEPRYFYCDRNCLPDSMIDRWWHDRQIYSDPFAIADYWRQAGATHVLIFETGGRFLLEQEPFDPMTGADFEALDVLRGTALHPVWDELDSYTLYRLQPDSP